MRVNRCRAEFEPRRLTYKFLQNLERGCRHKTTEGRCCSRPSTRGQPAQWKRLCRSGPLAFQSRRLPVLTCRTRAIVTSTPRRLHAARSAILQHLGAGEHLREASRMVPRCVAAQIHSQCRHASGSTDGGRDSKLTLAPTPGLRGARLKANRRNYRAGSHPIDTKPTQKPGPGPRDLDATVRNANASSPALPFERTEHQHTKHDHILRYLGKRRATN